MFGIPISRLPKLIVLDLDYTIWPLYADTHIEPPFKKKSSGMIVDRHGFILKLFPHVREILEQLKSKNIPVAVASRTGAVGTAEEAIKILDIGKFFAYKQIYSGSKVQHFKHFHKESGIPYREMLFYDDEQRNITDTSKLGVTAIYVPDGLNKDIFIEGLKQYQDSFKEEEAGTRL